MAYSYHCSASIVFHSNGLYTRVIFAPNITIARPTLKHSVNTTRHEILFAHSAIDVPRARLLSDQETHAALISHGQYLFLWFLVFFPLN